MNNFNGIGKLTVLIAFTLCSVPGIPFADNKRRSPDPFLVAVSAGTPVLSGFYFTSQPGLGIFFTGVDVVLIGSIINARTTQMQKYDAEKWYWYLLALNNITDLVLSHFQVQNDRHLKAAIGLTPSGVFSGIHYEF